MLSTDMAEAEAEVKVKGGRVTTSGNDGVRILGQTTFTSVARERCGEVSRTTSILVTGFAFTCSGTCFSCGEAGARCRSTRCRSTVV